MPLVVVCGQPCSGKSTVAAALAQLVRDAGCEVHIIDEPSLHLSRDEAYGSSTAEKATRGKLRSAAERSISKKAVTILDSLNNIKGYRYELWCIARAAATRYCLVHVDSPTDVCQRWNAARESDTYSETIFKDLASRFERPDTRNRWDSPLFTVVPGSEEEADCLQRILAAMVDAKPSSTAVTPLAGEQLAQDPDSAPVAQVAKDLRPNMATSNPALLSTNLLHDIDAAAQVVVVAIMEAQAAAGGGAAGTVTVGDPPNTVSLQLQQPVTLAELRRHKRGFIKLATKVTFARLQDAGAAQRTYVEYLREHVAGAVK